MSACVCPASRPAALHAGLTRLRSELRAAGSDLVIRTGPAWDVLAQLAQQSGVERIVMEREEESRWG
jgi:deoxyribodipyrimidine photolyase